MNESKMLPRLALCQIFFVILWFLAKVRLEIHVVDQHGIISWEQKCCAPVGENDGVSLSTPEILHWDAISELRKPQEGIILP